MAGLAAYTSNFCIHKLEASLVYSMRSVLFFFKVNLWFSHVFAFLRYFPLGPERWLSGYKHWLLFQRAWPSFLLPTQWFTTMFNSSSMRYYTSSGL